MTVQALIKQLSSKYDRLRFLSLSSFCVVVFCHTALTVYLLLKDFELGLLEALGLILICAHLLPKVKQLRPLQQNDWALFLDQITDSNYLFSASHQASNEQVKNFLESQIQKQELDVQALERLNFSLNPALKVQLFLLPIILALLLVFSFSTNSDQAKTFLKQEAQVIEQLLEEHSEELADVEASLKELVKAIETQDEKEIEKKVQEAQKKLEKKKDKKKSKEKPDQKKQKEQNEQSEGKKGDKGQGQKKSSKQR